MRKPGLYVFLIKLYYIREAEKQERMNLAIRIANGYDTKYNSPSTLESKLYEPFGNTCFYISKTGTVYIVSNNESNATFFEDNFKGKYIRDYFLFMYFCYIRHIRVCNIQGY